MHHAQLELDLEVYFNVIRSEQSLHLLHWEHQELLASYHLQEVFLVDREKGVKLSSCRSKEEKRQICFKRVWMNEL